MNSEYESIRINLIRKSNNPKNISELNNILENLRNGIKLEDLETNDLILLLNMFSGKLLDYKIKDIEFQNDLIEVCEYVNNSSENDLNIRSLIMYLREIIFHYWKEETKN